MDWLPWNGCHGRVAMEGLVCLYVSFITSSLHSNPGCCALGGCADYINLVVVAVLIFA
jgi:hypothetical protein